MNNSKENILKRIAAAGMPEYAYPDFGYEPQHFDDPAAPGGRGRGRMAGRGNDAR